MKGQIKRLAKGNWQIRVQTRNAEGERKSKSISGYESREKADEALKLLLKELTQARLKPQPKRYTFDFLFDAYLSHRQSELKPQTYNLYELLFRLYVRPTIGAKFLDDVTPYDIDVMYKELLKNISGTTLQKVHAHLKASLKVARRWRWVTENVLEDVSTPKKSTKEKEALTIDELNSFLDACENDKTFWFFFGYTGFRAQEVCGAKWKYLDWGKGSFEVKEVLVQKKDAELFQEPKTPKSVRKILLSPSLIKSLRAHRIAQQKQRLKVGSLWTDYDLIFPTEFGAPRHMTNLSKACREIKERAGIGKDVTPHIFRHSCATNNIREGNGLQQVADFLGHSDTTITSKIYTHLQLEDQQPIADTMERLIKVNVS